VEQVGHIMYIMSENYTEICKYDSSCFTHCTAIWRSGYL